MRSQARDHRVQVPCGMAVPSLFVPAQVQQAPRLVNDARRACISHCSFSSVPSSRTTRFLLQHWERYFKRGHYALKIRVFQNFRQKNCSKQNMNTTFPPTTTLETPSCLYSIEALNYPLGPRVPRRRDHRVQVPCGMAVPSLFVPAQVQQAPRLVNDARRACSSPERAA